LTGARLLSDAATDCKRVFPALLRRFYGFISVYQRRNSFFRRCSTRDQPRKRRREAVGAA
jgi:hypothetical protein